MLSQTIIDDIAHRSSFLSERDSIPTIYESGIYQKKLKKLQKKLNSDSSYLEDFLKEVEEQSESTIKSGPLKWYDFLSKALQAHNLPEKRCPDIKSITHDLQEVPFGYTFSPFLCQIQIELSDACKKHDIKISESLLKSFHKDLTSKLLEIAGLTVYALWNDDFAVKTASSENKKKHYEEWCSELASGGWENIAIKYPVLLRLMFESCHFALAAFVELLMRWQSDGASVAYKLNWSNHPLEIQDIEFGLSDLHKFGRTVCRLHLGDNKRIIYKPKSLAMESWFFETLIPILFPSDSPIYKFKILDKGNYGWMENLSLSKITEPEKIHEETIGKITALFYLLNASDLHTENIVLNENILHPLDLETLFNSSPKLEAGIKSDIWRNWSLLSTHLLRTDFGSESENRDMSGFFAKDINPPSPVFKLFTCAIDGVRYVVSKETAVLENREMELNSEIAQENNMPLPNLDDTKKAFQKALARYITIFQNQEAALFDGALSHCRTRFVSRPTELYSRLLERLRHPRFLSDGAIFSFELYEMMSILRTVSEENASLLGPLVLDEIKQLHTGDVPLFWHDVSGRDIFSQNGLIQANFLVKDGLNNVKDKFSFVCKEDFKEQCKLIEASYEMSKSSQKLPLRRHYDCSKVEYEEIRQHILQFSEILACNSLMIAQRYYFCRLYLR